MEVEARDIKDGNMRSKKPQVHIHADSGKRDQRGWKHSEERTSVMCEQGRYVDEAGTLPGKAPQVIVEVEAREMQKVRNILSKEPLVHLKVEAREMEEARNLRSEEHAT